MHTFRHVSAQVSHFSAIFVYEGIVVADMFDNTGHFIMFCMITNIYNKKTKGPTLMELFTATGKLNKFFFDN
jgi:uncharacterized membrane protein YhfC